MRCEEIEIVFIALGGNIVFVCMVGGCEKFILHGYLIVLYILFLILLQILLSFNCTCGWGRGLMDYPEVSHTHTHTHTHTHIHTTLYNNIITFTNSDDSSQ